MFAKKIFSWRSFRDEMITEPMRGFVDGDILSQFLEYDSSYFAGLEAIEVEQLRVLLVAGGQWKVSPSKAEMQISNVVNQRSRQGVLGDLSSSDDEFAGEAREITFESTGWDYERVEMLLEVMKRQH